ncbi:retinitis pigmentosa GTPase regulator b [Pimephales promelas]|nr:retinitis pigmentosa GTPase regulator b [Pimephales promelas]KAG1949786.1 retinitis pigmentosa GTPase regulator b [Pimephales promelas]
MAGETEDEIPETGAVFTFGKSKFADNAPSKFWLKNDVPLRISCGDEHTALVTENGKLFMFGSNNWGQLGLGTKTTVNKPTCVKALKSERVKLAACGRTHSLVYTSRGNLYASGGNNEGQLGLGDCDDRASFHLVDFFSKHGPIKMLAAGSNTSAVLTEDGRLYMWGDNSEGQIGLGKESNALTPREVSVGKRVSWVSCGYYHSAFVTVDGALFTFGEKDSGKLGLSTEKLANHKVPQQVTGISDKVVKVSCGGGHTVALTEHKVYSFGLGQFGQLGHGTFIFESRLPRVVEHFRRGRVKHVECGENHTALITDSGLLYTFGDGRHGKLGLGEENFTNQFRPTLCTRFLNCHVNSVTCGGCHMLVLAKPRAERSEDLILEEDDVTEDYFEKSCTELLGDTLNRSLSARVRRRERERSPDQFGQMFRTLPVLGGNHLSASLSVPTQIRHSQSNQPGKIPHNSLKSPGKREKSLDDRSNVEDSESVKDLGETTDLLNLTHIIKLDPSDKTLTLSPMEKKKVKVVKEHGKEKGKHSDGHAPYSKRAELSARKALPTELLRSSSGSSVVGDSLGSGTPQKCPKRHGHDKENVLIALENRKPAYHQAGGSNTDISRAGSKSSLPKHTELMKSREKVKKESTGKAKPNQEAESKKVPQKSKGSTKPNQEGIGKAKPKDRSLEVRSQPQKVVGKEKEVKMKPIIVVEHHLEQTTHKDQDPTGKKISKDDLPKAQRVKGEKNAAKTENKTFVPQSKKSDSKKDSKSSKTIQEISTTSQQSSSQEDVSTKKTTKPRAEQSQFLVEDKLKSTKKGPTIVSKAASKSESASESEEIKENPLIKVKSFLQDVGMGSSAGLLGASAVSQFLSQSTPQNIPKPPSKQRTLSDVSSLSESDEVSRQEETREAKRTAVTINMKTESGTSDLDLERSSIESKTQAHSEVGTFRRSEEESEEEESKGLVNRRDESEEVDDGEEESEGKTLDKRADDDDSEVNGDTTIKGSSEDEESEEEEDKSKSEATEDVESEAEEGESDTMEDKEEETSEISRKSEEESGDEEDESKTSKEEETESKNESSKEESEEENEESEVKDSEDEEENDVESDSAEEDSAEEDGDSEKTSEEKEDSEKLESESEDEGDEDGEKTSEEEEDDSEKQESETEDDDEGESESEAEEESEKVQVGEEESESNEEEAMSQNDEEEEERENEEEEERESNDEEEGEEEEEEQESEEEEEQESEDEEEQENKDEEEEGQESEEEEEQESEEEEEQESEEEEEQESEEEEDQESKDEEEEEQENNDEEEEEQESKDGEEEGNEEAEEEESEEKEEAEEAEDEEGEEEEEEQEEEEEEKAKAKRKREKASESTKQKSGVKTTKQPTKAKQARAQRQQSDDESQESQQFWDDVLPQYLNLK